jgi:glutathione S-transferase/nicotinamidase-related amidase
MEAFAPAPAAALLLIDLQRDFFAPHSFLGSTKAIVPFMLYPPIASLLTAARGKDIRDAPSIVWVKSDYSVILDHTEYGTHAGAQRACCMSGTSGAEISAPFDSLIHPTDTTIIKHTYSALEHCGAPLPQTLFVAGVMTHVCVSATVKHALVKGHTVYVIADACAASKKHHHVKALDELRNKGAHIVTTTEVLQMWGCGPVLVSLPKIGAGDCSMIFNCSPITSPSAAEASADGPSSMFDALKAEVSWSIMRQHGGPVPRLITSQGTPIHDETGIWDPLYRHPRDEEEPFSEWTPHAAHIKDTITRLTGHEINHALIQLYRDGSDWISEHCDKTLDIAHGTPIINASFGVTRTFCLRRKPARGGKAASVTEGKEEGGDEREEPRVQQFGLPDGSAFIMGAMTNRCWLHSIRKEGKPSTERDITDKWHGERISLTMRVIATFQRRGDRFIRGQGAPPLGAEPRPAEVQAKELISAFGDDNSQAADFDWHKSYGLGFTITAMKRKPVLYWANGSIPSWRVRLWLRENPDYPVEERRLLLMGKCRETRTPEFLAINPRGKTPTLVDTDGTVVVESLAILQHMAIKAGQCPWSGRVLARMMESNNLIEAYEPLEDLFKGPMAPTRIQESLSAVYAELDIWEGYLRGTSSTGSGSVFIAQTDTPSIADYAFYPILAYMEHRGLDLARWPAVHAYSDMMASRPSSVEARPNGWTDRGRVDVFKLAQEAVERSTTT